MRESPLKIQNGNFPVRTKYLEDKIIENMKAFYSLKPVQSSLLQGLREAPAKFLHAVCEHRAVGA